MANWKKVMLTAGGGGAGGWILNYTPSSLNSNLERVYVTAYDDDDTNKIFALFGNYRNFDIAELTSDGSVVAQKRIDPSETLYGAYPRGIVSDSSDNLYLIFFAYLEGNGVNIMKMNSSLVEQWESRFAAAYFNDVSIMEISGSNLHVLTHANDFNSTGRQLGFKVNTSTQNVTDAYGFNGIDGNENRGIFVDGSSNIYSAKGGRVGSSERAMLRKFGTSFSSLAWQRTYDNGSQGTGNDIFVDGSGNVYSCGFISEGNRQRGYACKLNSSGTQQWHTNLQAEGSPTSYGGFKSYQGGPETAVSCSLTSDGLVVVYFDYGNVTSNYSEINILVFDTSNGDIKEKYGIACTSSQWQPAFDGRSHFLHTDTHVYIPIRDEGNNGFILKLPTVDGSGIYGSYSLGSHSFVINSTVLGAQNPSYSWSSYTSGSGGSRTVSRSSMSRLSASSTTPTTSKLDI